MRSFIAASFNSFNEPKPDCCKALFIISLWSALGLAVLISDFHKPFFVSLAKLNEIDSPFKLLKLAASKKAAIRESTCPIPTCSAYDAPFSPSPVPILSIFLDVIGVNSNRSSIPYFRKISPTDFLIGDESGNLKLSAWACKMASILARLTFRPFCI